MPVAMPVAVEKREAELGFQSFEIRREGRLRDVDVFRRFGDAVALDDDEKIPKLLNVQDTPCYERV